MDAGDGNHLFVSTEEVEEADAVGGVEEGDAMFGDDLHVGGVELAREGDVRLTQRVEAEVGDDEVLVGLVVEHDLVGVAHGRQRDGHQSFVEQTQRISDRGQLVVQQQDGAAFPIEDEDFGGDACVHLRNVAPGGVAVVQQFDAIGRVGIQGRSHREEDVALQVCGDGLIQLVRKKKSLLGTNAQGDCKYYNDGDELFQVSGFKFQVSSFKSQISSLKSQVSSLKS